jgi:hypothetical protein
VILTDVVKLGRFIPAPNALSPNPEMMYDFYKKPELRGDRIPFFWDKIFRIYEVYFEKAGEN